MPEEIQNVEVVEDEKSVSLLLVGGVVLASLAAAYYGWGQIAKLCEKKAKKAYAKATDNATQEDEKKIEEKDEEK